MLIFTRDRIDAVVPLLVLSFFAFLAPARAADSFLAVGGGNSPSNNQVSLEKNILFFQRVLTDSLGKTASADVLFSDGMAGSRDLQFVPNDDPPKVNILLARLFGSEDEIYYRYRAHKLPARHGPSTRRGLDEWFNGAGKKLGDGDRLFIYFTGHGGSGNPAQNTTISMWCEPVMHVKEFVGYLDRLSPKVRVVLMMVQCHSGGFAGTIFKDGKPGGELSPARRCGFFATTFDRNAAGCTPDTVEDDYKDYSTYFFAALDGKTRTGKKVPGCDLNGDGHVSFAEAHAYVLLNSDTIDIPTTTSEALLRSYSKTTGDDVAKPQMPFKTLLGKSSPLQKKVLEGLCDQLKLTSDDRFDEAKHLEEILESQRKIAEQDRSKKTEEASRLAGRIRSRLLQKWPELSNPWHPRIAELLKADGPKIQTAVESDSDYARWDLLHRDADQLYDKALDLERQWVKCQRCVRALTTAALAQNLVKVASPAIVERYHQMVQDESGTLSSPER
ncbi:MAG TPA: C13 family peptidase [Tepidisphaeraceae bacterium]|jgi:hypothetical protein|nr:C13 family peptidase [Tepidisphaeraceae bacterium]